MCYQHWWKQHQCCHFINISSESILHWECRLPSVGLEHTQQSGFLCIRWLSEGFYTHTEALMAAMAGNSSDALFWQHRTFHCLWLFFLWTHFMHQYHTGFAVDNYPSDFDSICWIFFSYLEGTVDLLCKILDQLCLTRPHYSHWEPEIISGAVGDTIGREWHEEPTDLAHHVSSGSPLTWGISACPFWIEWMNKVWSLMNGKLFE